MRHYLFFMLLSFGSLAARADEPASQAPAPEVQAAALTAAADNGMALYRHDRAAWRATDVMLAHSGGEGDERVRGWVTQQVGDDIIVTFLDGTPQALYRVTVTREDIVGRVDALPAPAPLSDHEAGAAAARALAETARFERCTERYNTVVLPVAPASGEWALYLLPATTSHEDLPIGGAYRLDIKDGRILSQRGFSRSCISLKNDADAVGLMISHLMDPYPTEIHVFWSLWAKKPMYVGITQSGVLWKVDGATIAPLKKD